MKSAKYPYNTKTIYCKTSATRYCCYCGNVARSSEELDHRETYVYYNCTCDKAQEEYKIKSHKPPELPEVDNKLIHEIKYANELYELKRIYGKL